MNSIRKAKARLLPGFLNDKSAELRRDAIAAELERLERAEPKTIKADLEKLFKLTRDKDQVDLLVKKIVAKGGKVGVTEHFGFINHAEIIGPFDAPGGKGYETKYPPDTATDTSGKFKGKGGRDLAWKPASTTEKYGAFDLTKILDKHKDAVAYALAVVVAEKEMPCDIRVTTPNSVRIVLNGKELFGHEEYHHGAPFDAYIGKGKLKKGENVIVLKICQDDEKEPWAQAWQFQVRVCDDTGGPLPLEQKIVANGVAKDHQARLQPEPAPNPSRRSDNALRHGRFSRTCSWTHTLRLGLAAVPRTERHRRFERQGPSHRVVEGQGHQVEGARCRHAACRARSCSADRVYVTLFRRRATTACTSSASTRPPASNSGIGNCRPPAAPPAIRRSCMAAPTPVADETGVYAALRDGRPRRLRRRRHAALVSLARRRLPDDLPTRSAWPPRRFW